MHLIIISCLVVLATSKPDPYRRDFYDDEYDLTQRSLYDDELDDAPYFHQDERPSYDSDPAKDEVLRQYYADYNDPGVEYENDYKKDEPNEAAAPHDEAKLDAAEVAH